MDLVELGGSFDLKNMKKFHKQLTPNIWVTKEKTYKKGENLGVDKTIQSSFQKKNSKWPF